MRKIFHLIYCAMEHILSFENKKLPEHFEHVGICYVITVYVVSRNLSVKLAMSCASDFLTLCQSWTNYSGSSTYPVPSKDEDFIGVSDHKLKMWDKNCRSGRLRWELVHWMKNELKAFSDPAIMDEP